jgi:hypothetical protein
MSDAVRARQFGDGPLSRISAAVYTLLVVEVLLLLATAPGLVLLTLLRRDASNLPLVALGAVPVGPALSAALVALAAPRDLMDLRPAAAFLHAFRRDAVAVLRVWIPLLAILTVIGVNLAHQDAAGVPAGWRAEWVSLLLVIAAGALLWGVNALVIVSFFSFRTRDVARLAWYLLAAAPGVTLGTGCLLAAAAAVVAVSSEAVLALLGSVLASLLLQTCRPLIARVEREFTG